MPVNTSCTLSSSGSCTIRRAITVEETVCVGDLESGGVRGLPTASARNVLSQRMAWVEIGWRRVLEEKTSDSEDRRVLKKGNHTRLALSAAGNAFLATTQHLGETGVHPACAPAQKHDPMPDFVR